MPHAEVEKRTMKHRLLPVANFLLLVGIFVLVDYLDDGGGPRFDDAGGRARPRDGLSQDFIRGDANDDGSLNIGDVVWLLNELFVAGSPQTDCPLADDANADGLVNIADAITLLDHLFAGDVT